MKRVITATGNEYLNNKLKEIDTIDVKERDIFYIDGIFEYLEKDCDIDIVIINEEICMDDLEHILRKTSIYEFEVYLILKKQHYKEEFQKYNKVKLFSSEEEIICYFENREYKPEKVNNLKLKNNRRVISIIGSSGVGKTVFCSLLGKYLAKNNKVLLINFDLYSNDLKNLFNIKKQIKNYDINSLITKVEKNLYILSEIKYIFNKFNMIDNKKVKEIIENLKQNFDYIIIDTSSEISSKYIKSIFPNCDYNVFLLEPNSLEIEKSRELLELYLLDYGLDLKKTGIFINKYNISSIDLEIVRNVFEKIKIIGKINYTSKVNSYINTYTKNNVRIDDILKLQKYLTFS